MNFSRWAVSVAGVSMLLGGGSVPAAEPGFYVGAAIGQAQQEVDPGQGILFAGTSLFGGLTRVLPDATTTEDDITSWNASLGYRIDDYFSAELSYADFGSADVSEHYTLPVSGIFGPAQLTRQFTSSITGPVVSILGSLPIGSGFELFARAGYLFADQKIELGGQVIGQSSMTFGDEIWLAGGGVTWSFAQRWALRAEYVRTEDLRQNAMLGETDVEQLSLGVLFKL